MVLLLSRDLCNLLSHFRFPRTFYTLSIMSESKKKHVEKVSADLLKEWEQIQDDLRTNIVTIDTEEWQQNETLSSLKMVAGLDISYPKDAHDQNESDAFAAVVICKYPSMDILHQEVELVRLDAPYIPGFLAFRECPVLLSLLKKVMNRKPELKPDVLLIDGNGLLHPQKCGIACHIGYHTSIPSIGVAKNLFVMDGVECTKKMLQDMKSVGDFIYIRDKDNFPLGMGLKSSEKAINPIYVSIGHRTSLETARKIVLGCCKYRIPEPLRFADSISREFIRKQAEENTNTSKTGNTI